MSRTERHPARVGLAYGAAAIVGLARGDRRLWALHRAALVRGLIPATTAEAVADAARTLRDGEPLGEVLAGVEVEALDLERAVVVGTVAAAVGTDDLAGAALVELAARRNVAAVSDRSHRLAEVASQLGHDLVLHVP